MDYKIAEKPSFSIVGKSLETTCKDNENSRAIPAFWHACNQDGTADRLSELSPGKPLLGVCYQYTHENDTLKYWVAVEAGPSQAAGFEATIVPAATWAIFTSTGAMPSAIQETWGRIFQEWFPSTDYQHSGGPELEVYLDGDVDAADYQCEIWIPVKK
jgi:AraC family transcriptional regulator